MCMDVFHLLLSTWHACSPWLGPHKELKCRSGSAKVTVAEWNRRLKAACDKEREETIVACNASMGGVGWKNQLRLAEETAREETKAACQAEFWQQGYDIGKAEGYQDGYKVGRGEGVAAGRSEGRRMKFRALWGASAEDE
jgi:flagellar biosynthesis/type III secretory pathway protein FliH